MTTIRKAIAAALTGIATWGITAQPDGFDSAEWWGLFGVLVGAILVWLTPNETPVSEVSQRLRDLGIYDPEHTTRERGQANLTGVLWVIFLVLAIIFLLRALGVL